MLRTRQSTISQAEPDLNEQRLACPRSKSLGDSSSINGVVYVKGHAKDFITHTNINKILIKNKTASGVEFFHHHQIKHAHATREIICCPDDIGSPTILQCSAVGHREALQQACPYYP